jgi:hypothetical protein
MNIALDITDWEPLLSGYLAALTADYGFGRCYERAQAALKLAPEHLQPRLTYVVGTLHNAVGLEPDGSDEHGWLMLDAGDSYSVIDPTIAAYILDGGMPADLQWELDTDKL